MSNNTIRFLFRGQEVELDLEKNQISPTTTVLRYLRESGCSTGTKEGCAEGDCGACTVVVAETDDSGTLLYKAVDSCLMFLPMLHGKQLITVEDLESDGEPHAVQRAMVECNGTQCGYCTPGFVMSLFALSKQNSRPEQKELEDALTGNLCRCTGYRPILDAAKRCVDSSHPDHFSKKSREITERLSGLDVTTALSISVVDQHYHKPTGLEEALSLLAENPRLIPFSGATDLALRVTKKHERLSPLLDLSGIKELHRLEMGHDFVHIGSGVPLETLRIKLRNLLPALTDMLDVFGSRQIRTLATLGGNLGSASPIGDMLPVLMAYGAHLVLTNNNTTREVPMREFITGYRATVRKPDELIVQISIPIPPSDTIIKAYKVSKRKDLDISTVSAAMRLTQSEGIIRDVVIAYGGMAEKTARATDAESYLMGKPWGRTTAEEAAERVRRQFNPISDARSGAEFRRIVAGNLLLKFWNETT